MCTWMVIETVGFFLRNGSEVFSCAMDMTKAFDLVKHSLLFRKLLSAGLPPIFIRVLLFIYSMQYANSRWNEEVSDTFLLSNGVRQGAILSAILYCFYVNDLFKILRNRRAGCWVNDNYHGIIGYSDDSFLLAPSLSALQEMLQTERDVWKCSKVLQTFGIMCRGYKIYVYIYILYKKLQYIYSAV